MIQPLGDRVVIEPTKQEQMLPSGIYLPEAAIPKATEGKVIAVGDDADSTLINKIVTFPKYAGTEVEVDKQKLLIVKQGDILAIMGE